MTIKETSEEFPSLGQRIRYIRIKDGISQAALAAASGLSKSYLSLIEAGRRVPSGAALQRLSRSLRVSPEELLGGQAADSQMVAATLQQAQGDLDAGNAARARRRLDLLMRRCGNSLRWETECQIRLLNGQARYRSGDVTGGIAELESMLSQPDVPADLQASLLRTLTECYSDTGDVNRAIELGQRGVDLCLVGQLTAAEGHRGQLESNLVELGALLAAAYRQRGDMLSASVITSKILDAAERSGQAQLRGGALRAASLNAEASGQTEHAAKLAARALAAYEEQGSSGYQRVLMQVDYARILLNLGPGQAQRAEKLVIAAGQALGSEPRYNATRVRCKLQLARARIALGRLDEGIKIATEVAGDPQVTNLDAARALTEIAQATLHASGRRAATEYLQRAHDMLTGAKYSRPVAQAWRELGDAYAQAGSAWLAVEAYDRALNIAGIRRLHGVA